MFIKQWYTINGGRTFLLLFKLARVSIPGDYVKKRGRVKVTQLIENLMGVSTYPIFWGENDDNGVPNIKYERMIREVTRVKSS